MLTYCALQYCTKHTSCYSLRPCSVTAAVTSLELCYNDNDYNNPHFIVHAEMCCKFFSYQYLLNCYYTRAATCNAVWGLLKLKQSDNLVSPHLQNIVMPQVQSNIEAALSVIPATSPILLDRCAACYYWHALLRWHAYTYLKIKIPKSQLCSYLDTWQNPYFI